MLLTDPGPLHRFRLDLGYEVREALDLPQTDLRGFQGRRLEQELFDLARRAEALGLARLAAALLDVGGEVKTGRRRPVPLTDEPWQELQMALGRLCCWTEEEWARYDAEGAT